ncbi:MAG: septum formation initiator family protein [Bacteroidales bacterium]
MDKIKVIVERLIALVKWINVPLAVVLVFLIILLFVGDYSYVKNADYKNTANAMEREIKLNYDTAKYYQRKIQELNTDKESLEKIAREQYKMKRDNEDVYITPMK